MKGPRDTREFLQSGSVLYLRPYLPQLFDSENSFGGPVSETAEVFSIVGQEGCGSSAICYEAEIIAENGTRRRGKLKEFYPVDSDDAGLEMHLVRTDSVRDENKNQIYSKFGTFHNFFQLKRIYENSYAIIEKKRNDRSYFANDLNKYIPKYSFYCGIPSQPVNDELDGETAAENYTFYVWVENESGIQEFDAYLAGLCREMQENRTKNIGRTNRIHDLAFVLNCILELAKCMDILHRFGLYHLDLNPRNFGVGLYNDRIDQDNTTIKLYDTNSLLSDRIREQVLLSSGTPYFRSPEVIRNDAEACGIQSDIYSLGAILFYALVIREKDGAYRNIHFCEGTQECSREAYDNLAVDFVNSELLQSSDDTKQTLIFEHLLSILKKSLNRFYEEEDRYTTVGDLAEDLRQAIEQTGLDSWKRSIEEHSGYHAQTILENKETFYDREIGAAGAIQKLLFQEPLYQYGAPSEDGVQNCDILVIGCGTYASEFIDYALELSQVKGCRLHVTVVTKECERKKETYLSIRKALPLFFDIDGVPASKCPAGDSYGTLNFREIRLQKGKSRSNAAALRAMADRKYSYVFIALNDDVLNLEIASACGGIAQKNALIAFVQYQTCDVSAFPPRLKPVFVNETLQDIPEYRFLLQMAFNIHLTWDKDYINDLEGAESEFRKPYNFNSSMENALSIVYKLHSVGIDLDFNRPETASSAFSQITDQETIRALICYEHRRWVVEKITSSWQPMEDLSPLTTDTKDRDRRLHPCILTSTESRALNDPQWTADDRARWDDPNADLSELDPLDALSIRFHRHWKTVLDGIRSQKGESAVNRKMDDLQGRLENDEKRGILCDSLRQMINQLIYQDSYNTGAVAKYHHLFNQLNSALKNADLSEAAELLSEIGEEMTPVLEYRQYTDWKKKDENLIRNMPFVLTYHTGIHLCIPFFFEAGAEQNTSRLFSNVASVLMVNPKTVTYIVDGERAASNEQGLLSGLRYVVNILEKHGLQTALNIKILRDERYKVSMELKTALGRIGRVQSVDTLPYQQWLQTNALRQFLTQKSSGDFTAIEVNDTNISGCLQSANYTSDPQTDVPVAPKPLVPAYGFDSVTRKFFTTDGCAFLQYIDNAPVLFSEDLYDAKGKMVQDSRPELMRSYQLAWSLYTGESPLLTQHDRAECSAAWKKLCGSISNYIAHHCKLADIHYREERAEVSGEPVRYIVPAFCQTFLDRFLRQLKHSLYGFFESHEWKWLSSRTVCLEIAAPSNSLQNALETLLSDPIRLSQNSLLEILRTADGFQVVYKSLRISDLVLPEDCAVLCREMLEILQSKGYIRGFRMREPAAEGGPVSFVFACEHLVHLLSDESYLFRLNAYYEALRSGYFDDVSIGVKIVWNDEGLNNEVGVVLTRGFQTITLDCRTSPLIEQENYYRLYPLSKIFGINTIPVLLVDLGGAALTPANRMEIRRGEELGIKTICSTEDLARTLKDLFDMQEAAQRLKKKML